MSVATANDTVRVAQGAFGIDSELELIVVGLDVAELNALWPGTKVAVELDLIYRFEPTVDELSTGVGYPIVDDEGDHLVLYFTALPIARINTPHTIVDDPKVPARFELFAQDLPVPPCDIGIEIRGGFAQSLPKKSFLIEFWEDPSGEGTVDRALLGMRNDDDWNLQSLYNEPLRITSPLNNRLWTDIHQPYYAALEPEAKSGISMEHVELFLNDRYQGIYAFGERVDRKQLKLEQFDGGIRGELYRGVGWGASTFTSMPPYDNNSILWSGFEYEHPEELVDWSRLHGFVDFVINASDEDFVPNYPEQFHMGTAVDYFLFLNLLRLADNAGKNIFIARYDQGEPYFYIPWDLDNGFGVIWDGTRQPVTDDVLTNGLYARLMDDCTTDGFRSRLRARWQELREDLLAYDPIMHRFNEAHDRLAANGVYDREALAWPDFVHDTDHLDYAGLWLQDRLTFLDVVFGAPCTVGLDANATIGNVRLFPNPTTGSAIVQIDPALLPCDVYVTNTLGQRILQLHMVQERTTIDLSGSATGIYQVSISGQGMHLRRSLVVE
ncbi:MAG TPA: CotH kinase family protein [Flavobacteriales bacterium]|nr:CotH kinase family protein [Flavobacteriales bacterium]